MNAKHERPDEEPIQPSDELESDVEEPSERDLPEVDEEPGFMEADTVEEATSADVAFEPADVEGLAEAFSPIRETLDASPDAAGEPLQPGALPLFDDHGHKPREFRDIVNSMRLWEEAAAEAGDDPLFTPQPTTKHRNQLMLLRRGPGYPHVWLDHENMRPVQYSGDVDTALPTDPRPQFTIAPPSEQPLEPEGNEALMRPELVVTVHRAPGHFLAALETRAARIDRRIELTIEEKILAERRWQAEEYRRIYGTW